MKRMHSTGILLALFASVACVRATELKAKCAVDKATGDPTQPIEGMVSFTQPESGDIEITIDLSGFNTTDTVMKHGFHVHAVGNMSEKCGASGGHYNPDGVVHGAPDATVRHVGDLGNIEEDGEGRVRITITDKLLRISGDKSVVGRAIVIHAGEDDLGLGGDAGSKATGNAGARLACCKIEEDLTSSAHTVLYSGLLLLTATALSQQFI